MQTLLTQSFEAERSLRHFSSVASQELITLLAAALADLNTNESSESAKKSLERAIFVSRNIRYFTSGTRADCALTDLSQLVLDCIHLRESDFQKRNISLDIRIESSVFSLVDPIALEQAFLNLLDFASSHAMSGSQVQLGLQVLAQGLQFRLGIEGTVKDNQSENPSLELCTLESLEAQNLALLGLHVCTAIFEAHSGVFQCYQSKAEGIQLVVQFPLDARFNKPHLFREKRRYQRVKVDFPGTVKLQDGTLLTGRVTVLSAGGAFVAVSHDGVARFQHDQRVAIEIQTDSNHTLSIPLARVANTHPSGENSGVGLEFLELDVKAKNLLAVLVKAHAS